MHSNESAADEMKPVRIGIIGCGNVLTGYRATIEKLRAAGTLEVVAACGRENQMADATRLLGEVRFTTEAEKVLFADDVDLVLILTSMKEHARLATEALGAGKHVVARKAARDFAAGGGRGD